MAAEVWIELRGLRVAGRVGVSDAELESEREIEIDLDLIPRRARATETDELADTVDYARVASLAEEVVRARPHRTLERLAEEIAAAVLALEGVAEVGVRVVKPLPPMSQRIESVAVRLAREDA